MVRSLALVVVACVVGAGEALVARRAATSVTRAVSVHAGFASTTRRKKNPNSGSGNSKAPSNADGWVELRGEAPFGAKPQAVGKSITGKPYLVQRAPSDDALRVTSTDCGRCEYPLLKSPVVAVEGTDEVTCDMCGAKADLATGATRPSSGGGNPLLAPLLRSKPQKKLLTYPVKELADGRVFVNITPK